MICICVACMLQQPSLFLLSAEHRQVFQTIVSPDVNIVSNFSATLEDPNQKCPYGARRLRLIRLRNYDLRRYKDASADRHKGPFHVDYHIFEAELEHLNLLVCINCLHQIQLVQGFQQTALRGARNLIMLYKSIEQQNSVQNVAQVPVKTEPDPLPPSSTRKEVEFIEVPKHPALIKNELQDISEESGAQTREIKLESSLSEELVIKNYSEPYYSGSDAMSLESHHEDTDINEPMPMEMSKASTTITETQCDVHFEVLTHRKLSEKQNNKPTSDAANVSPDQAQANTRIPQPLQPDPSAKNETGPLAKKETDPSAKKESQQTRKKNRVRLSAAEKQEVLDTYKRLHDDWPKHQYVAKGILYKKTAEIHGISPKTVKNIVNSYSTNRRIQCKECDMTLSSQSTLQAHILVKHTEVTPGKCDICGDVFKNDIRLLQHKKKKHTVEIAVESTIDNLNLEWFCSECQIQCSNRTSFKYHMMTLKHATRDQWRFECETCHRRFPTTTRLDQHVNTQHLKKFNYKCDKCDKSYARPGRLRTHVAVVHDKQKRKKRYFCHLCGDGFTYTKSLREHLFKHSGERPFACPLCPATFTFSAALYTHNRLKHLKYKKKLDKKKGKGRKKTEKLDAEGIDEDTKRVDQDTVGTEKGDMGDTEMEGIKGVEVGETEGINNT